MSSRRKEDDCGTEKSSEGAIPDGGMISVRIVHVDHYMQSLSGYSASAPFQAAWLTHDNTSGVVGEADGGAGGAGGGIQGDHSSGKASTKVPVIRIFGTTPGGQRCCAHIHGLRPYLHIAPPKTVTQFPHVLYEYATSLRAALETALRAAFGSSGMANAPPDPITTNGMQANAGEATSATPAVDAIANIEPVVARSIYGFSSDVQIFLKISTYFPATVSRIATLLTHQALPSPFDKGDLFPHSAHIPFVLQFLTDFALAGMDFIHLSTCKFRQPLPSYYLNNQLNGESRKVDNVARPNGMDLNRLMQTPVAKRIFDTRLNTSLCSSLFWPFHVPKRTTSPVEFDAFADDILNPRAKPLQCHSFVSRTLATLWQEERLRTGVLPPRIIPPTRLVRAGAHLSSEEARDRLHEVLHTSPLPSDDMIDINLKVDAERADVFDEQQQSIEESQNFVTQSLSSFSNVWNYLDASVLGEADLTRIPPFPDDDVIPEEEIEEEDAIAQTWRDIADCTQQIRKPPLPNAETLPPQLPSSGTEKVSDSIEFALDTPTTPRLLRPILRAMASNSNPNPTPSLFQRKVLYASPVVKPPPVSVVLEDLPPQEWPTPFYGMPGDYMRANINCAPIIRKPGAVGFPPFSLPFSIPTTLYQQFTFLTPIQKPPTLSMLRSRVKSAMYSKGVCMMKSHGGTFGGIDSAGRRRIHRASSVHALFSTPELFVTPSPSMPLSNNIEDVLEHVLQDDTERHSQSLKSESSEDDDVKPSDKIQLCDSEADNVTCVPVQTDRPLSPKYDETFQITINPSTSCKLYTSKASLTSSS